jgi:hypothetical protein
MKALMFSTLALGLLAAPAFAAEAPKTHDASGMRMACAKDFDALCPGAEGQKRMMCMQQNRDKASAGCKEAMAAMGQRGGAMGGQMGGGQMGGQMGDKMGTGMPPAAKP